MKQAIYCLCGVFAVSTASATVYDGTYTGNINTTNDSLIEKGAIFDNAKLSVADRTTLTILDNVQFINNGYIVPNAGNYGTATFNIAISGDNVTFRNNKNTTIMAGVYIYEAFKGAYAGQLKVSISGNHTVFDNNSATQYSNYVTRGGAIFLGVPSSQYYSPYTWYTQALHIDGEGTVFSKNTAHYGGAIYSNSGVVAASNAVEFSNNSVSSGGGAIYITNANTRSVRAKLELAENTVFAGNTVANGDGGAIYNGGSYARIGADSIFRGNAANKGGALYNDGRGALMELDTGTSAVHFETASDSIYNNGGTISFLGTGLIDAGLTRLTSVRGDDTANSPVINLGRASAVFDTVNLSDNTTLKTTVWADGRTVKAGNISANTFNIQNNDELKLQIAVENRNILSPDGSVVNILTGRSGSQDSGWDYFGNPEKHPKFVAANNLLYDIEFVSDGVYKITPKANANPDPSDDSDIVDGVASAWNMAGFKSGSTAESIADQLYVLSQFDDTLPEYKAALSDLMPDDIGVVRDVIANNTNAGLRFLSRRMVMGKTGFWANGGYKALDNGDAYTGYAFGGAFGQDIAFMNGIFTLGQMFGYTQANVSNKVRKYDVQNNFDLSLYGQINIPVAANDIYINAIVGHGAYNITEQKNVLGQGIDSELAATQTSAQGNIGLKRGMIGGDIGYRYTNISLGAYTDSIGQRVSSIDSGLSHALARLYIADTDGDFQWGAHVGGEFAVGGADAYKNIATAPNGQRYAYAIKGGNDTALTFGANMDFAITSRIMLGLAYGGSVGGDYSEHSGKLRFNWAL